MLKITLLAAAAALSLSGAALAQDGRTTGKLDRDGDRRVSLAEMQAASAARFARLDANSDGQLTREERRAGRSEQRAQRVGQRAGRRGAGALARRDRDGDGALSQTEAPKRFAARFAQLDANRDGRLTGPELQAGRLAVKAERGPEAARPGRTRLDADRDGVLTRAEADLRVQARFARLDADHDGFITVDERRTARGQRRA